MTLGQKLIVGALVALGAAEVYGIRHPGNGDTVSELTRAVFHTDTAVGRAIFLTAFGGASAWFVWHVLDGSRRRK